MISKAEFYTWIAVLVLLGLFSTFALSKLLVKRIDAEQELRSQLADTTSTLATVQHIANEAAAPDEKTIDVAVPVTDSGCYQTCTAEQSDWTGGEGKTPKQCLAECADSTIDTTAMPISKVLKLLLEDQKYVYIGSKTDTKPEHLLKNYSMSSGF